MPDTPDDPAPATRQAEKTPPCDICGSPDTVWVMCKLICRNCRALVMSCADL